MDYDAIILLSFGGPEGMDDVMPFLRNVTRGRNVPDERLQTVAHHYEMFDGVSPINEQNRELLKELKPELRARGIELPIYWGNRNWHPMLEDTVALMAADGIKHAIGFATAAYSSYSSCRQYLEDIERARTAFGEGAPSIDKIHPFYNHPKFIQANVERLQDALNKLTDEQRRHVHVAFTAHSIPMGMAAGCRYAEQLNEVAAAVAKQKDLHDWNVVYQSRSGPPSQTWLEPDILDHIKMIHQRGKNVIVIAPVGFVSDHMEVIYDLDIEARQLCAELGIVMERAKTAGTHPLFVSMIADLIEVRFGKRKPEAITDSLCPDDLCQSNCCPARVPTEAGRS